MTRETKTKAEIEAMILEEVRKQPNGDLVEGLEVYLPETADSAPAVGVGWLEAGRDMRPVVSTAIAQVTRLCRQYEVSE